MDRRFELHRCRPRAGPDARCRLETVSCAPTRRIAGGRHPRVRRLVAGIAPDCLAWTHRFVRPSPCTSRFCLPSVSGGSPALAQGALRIASGACCPCRRHQRPRRRTKPCAKRIRRFRCPCSPSLINLPVCKRKLNVKPQNSPRHRGHWGRGSRNVLRRSASACRTRRHIVREIQQRRRSIGHSACTVD